jgi:hypothetical protein
VLGYDVEAAGVMKIVHVCSLGRSRAEWRVVMGCKERRWHLDGWTLRAISGAGESS